MGENIWLDSGGHRIWPTTENLRADKWWKVPPDLVAERFRKSELKALLVGTDKHLSCGQKWVTKKFPSAPEGFSGTDPAETSTDEGSDGHHTPSSPMLDEMHNSDAEDPPQSPLAYTTEDDIEADSNDEYNEVGFKSIGHPIFTGNLDLGFKVFFNEDHGKHIKIEPVKIPSNGYCGKTTTEEIRNPLTDIITNNNTTYVVCK